MRTPDARLPVSKEDVAYTSHSFQSMTMFSQPEGTTPKAMVDC
jgi:hypothetical protein